MIFKCRQIYDMRRTLIGYEVIYHSDVTCRCCSNYTFILNITPGFKTWHFSLEFGAISLTTILFANVDLVWFWLVLRQVGRLDIQSLCVRCQGVRLLKTTQITPEIVASTCSVSVYPLLNHTTKICRQHKWGNIMQIYDMRMCVSFR